ncbi:uncharacterized protein si:dkeyp-121d4.3 isoform X3 [Ictalurus furcatus]|uniref:uncharacterized protein si:dkeyp-121d4.3 isoform X3 n=1 Tax=Ictalurus furcatus TaxID=66913 RepID=UPI0023510537|nr:uncharacterized protein si:dkeyp-121d4.3 isoform X3 [Ictalurus furcatus]
MSKGRKRSKAKAAAKAAGFGMPPGARPQPSGGLCIVGPPLPVAMMPGDHFPMGPPDFGPPVMEDGPFMNEPPEFITRDRYVHRPGLHPQEFEMPPRLLHPDLEDRLRGFRPDPYEGRPGFHPAEFEGGLGFRDRGFVPPEFRDRASGFVPPEFRDRSSGFVPPEFRDRPSGFVPPEFRDEPPGFVPPEFRDRPPGFVPPEFRDRPPGFVPPEFRDRPPGFVPPAGIRPSQFEDGPGYPMINHGCGPINEYNAMDPAYMQPLDVHLSNVRMADVFSADAVQGTEQSNAPPMASCPPDRTHQANQQSSGPGNNVNGKNSTTTTTTTKSTSKNEISVVKHMLGSVKPPPGRSLGVITFIANNYGFIECEDLKKYSFSFDAFFGQRNHLVPGVKVHFTAVKVLGEKKECATDVKVAPGGTEEIEATIYEGVVTAVLPDTYVLEPHPGRIRTILTTEPVKLPFGRMDAKATLLLFDRVKFQLLTDVITKVRRATNITPQMPETFQLTKEIREKGVIMNIKDDSFTIMSKKHENLTASLSEYLSDDQLNVMDEAEFTVITVKDTLKAIRLKKLPEGAVEFDSQAKNATDPSAGKSMWKPVTSKEATVDEDISSEKYEGTISKVIPKSSEKEMGQQQKQGLVDTTVDGTMKSLPFGSGDVITQATMMVGDKVQFNIATKLLTKEDHAINIQIQPDTFQLESTEKRKIGVKGFAGGKRAIRIRRLTESVFTSVPKIEEKKEKKKMTIKLLKDPKEHFKNQVKTEGKGCDLLDAEKPGREKVDASKAPKQDNKSKQENPIKGSRERSRSRESRHRCSRSSSRSRDRSGGYYGKNRSSSRDRTYRSYRRSRSRSRDRSRRYRRSYSRSRSRSRERNSRGGKKRSHSPEYMDDHHRGQSNNKEYSSKRQSRSPDGHNKTSKYAANSFDYMNSSSTEAVNNELAKKRKELLELNELIARKKAIMALEQNTKTPSQFKDALEMEKQHGIATFDYQHKTCVENSWTPDTKPVRSILKKHSESLTSPQHQENERSESPEEPVGCPKTHASSIYMSAGSVPVWIKQSSTPEIEDHELARKKRQLEELSECIARKRAIMAMELKAKTICDGSEIKKKYDFGSCSDDLDITMTNKHIWQFDIKPDLQPKKSILKKRSESVTDQPQKDLTSAGQYAHFPMSKQPKDDHSTFLNLSGPSDTAFKKPCNPPSVFSNTVDLFKKLVNESSTSSSMSSNKAIAQQSFQPSSGLIYDQESARETKDQSYSTSPSQTSRFSHQDCDQASTSESSSTQSSASKQKTNLATQMERFLGALNKADSNLLTSLLRDARKDTDRPKNQRSPQEPTERMSCGDELYDPFKETDCNEDNYRLMGSKQNMNPMLRQNENTQDDLLPHERAVVDGSGFSKIVGMKYGIEAKPENRFLRGEAMPSSSQSKLLEQHENFLKECDTFKLSQDRYGDEPYFEDSYAEDRERYKTQKLSEKYRVEGSLSPVHQKSKDANEDVAQKASHYKTIQELLQTIGLNLDTTEVSKLADRTKERLYGKKVKPQSSHSFDQKDEHSISRYERRGSSHSTDSEGVNSVSPAKTSNREVYMSYLDTLKCRHNDGAVEDLFRLKRTIRNSPEAKQMTSDSYESAPPEVRHDSYKPIAESLSLAQSVGLQHTQISSEFSSAAHHLKNKQDSRECSYAIEGEQNPYGSIYQNPLHYATVYPTQPSHLPSGYGDYTASARPFLLMTPSPAQFYPTLSTFNTTGSFGPSPTPPYPPTSGQFGFVMQSGSSGYATQQAKTKPTTHNRCLKTIETVETLKSVSLKPSAVKEVRTVISIQTEKYAEGKAESQAAPMMEDDIKAKQKKRLEQFNQRMRLKKEQQMEAQRTRGQSQKSAPGKVIRTEVKNVWICGHSLVFWAEKRATSPEIGMQLGMDPNSVRIWWKGVQGMTWQQLLPQLLQLKDNWPKPDMILIHLGGNDIGKMTPEAFVLAVKKDLISLKSIFPQCFLVWSDILPRKSWRHSDDSMSVNNMRQAINKTVRGIMAELGGSSLAHDNIIPRLDSGLYRPDGVHLSGKGIDTFNLNMQDFLEKWESEISERETSES